MDNVHRGNREANVQDSPPVLVKHKLSDFSVESRFVLEVGKKPVLSNRDPEPTESSHGLGDQEQSSRELPCCENVLPRPSSTGGITGHGNRTSALTSSPVDTNSLGNNLRTFQPYIRNSRSCPLHLSGNDRVGQSKRTNDPSRPKSRDLSTSTSTIKDKEFCPLHSSKRSENESSPTKKISVIDLSNVDSPDSSVSLGPSSLLENLQRAHDGNTGISPVRDGTLSSCHHENESTLDQTSRNSRIQDTSSVDSISPSRNTPTSRSGEMYKTPLNSNLLTNLASPEIEHDRLSPSLRRPRPSSSTGSTGRTFTATNLSQETVDRPLHSSVDRTRTSPFAPVRDLINTALTPPASGNFVGQFGMHSPFECRGMRDALSPPWSHLQPSYSLNSTPPRPYTLSINSPSVSPLHNNHCCSPHRQYNSPRAIPVLPPAQLPTFRQGRVVSTNLSQFNGEYRSSHELGCVNFGHNLTVPMVNQTYNLPRAFDNTSPRTAQLYAKSGSYRTSKDRDSGSVYPNENNGENTSKKITTHTLNPPTQTISVDLTTDSSDIVPSQPLQIKLSETSRDQHTGIEESDKSRGLKSGDVKKPSTEDRVKKAVDTEIKKRRGRPPGSKNKKTISKNLEKEVNSEKKFPKEGETSKNEEEKESVDPKVGKTKKVESPILRPTDEEFKDPIKYLKSVQSTLKKFGICIIDPPESWKVSVQ